MPTKVILPEMGEGVTDATITQWLKQEGDRVEQYEALVEVNTDKVDTEVPSPVSGTLLKINHPPDTVVSVNQVLCWVGEPGEEIPEEQFPTPAPSAKPKATPPLPAPAVVAPPTLQTRLKPQPSAPALSAAIPPVSLRGVVSPLAARTAAEHGIDPATITGTGLGGMVTRQDVLAALDNRSAAARSPSPDRQPVHSPSSTWISPVVSRLAAEHHIDLNKVQGTGLDGRITKLDMLRVIAEGGKTTSLEPHPAYAGMLPGTLIKHTPVRRSIAKRMVESRHTSPHVSTFMEVDLSQVSAHRAASRAGFGRQGANLTFTAYFVAAAAAALRAYPLVNSSWSEEGVLLHPDVNIGMAVSLDAEGLIVPVIRAADQLDLLGIARAVNDLASRARSKQLIPDEVQGGTFTITNHGTSGSLFASPIINQPQCGILGTGAIQKRAVVVTQAGVDAIAIRPMAYFGLTFDHRILDGAAADHFLAAIKQTLENWG